MVDVKLGEYLSDRGIKISWLSEKTGVSKTTLYKIRDAQVDGIKFNTLNAICNALGCELTDIIVYTRD